jgi:hypothetical protein
MALSIPSLTLKIHNAFVAGGAVPGNPLLVAMSTAMANGIISEILAAEISPSGDPPAGPMLAPSGGGPVTGNGKIT